MRAFSAAVLASAIMSGGMSAQILLTVDVPTGDTENVDAPVSGTGSILKIGGGTANIRSGVAITGDVDVNDGHLTVEGAVTAANIQTGGVGNSDSQVIVDGGGVAAAINLRWGADLSLINGGVVAGNVSWNGDLLDVFRNDVSLSGGSSLYGSVTVRNGDVDLSAGTSGAYSYLQGAVTILNDGDVTLDTYSMIAGDIDVNTGDVSLSNFSAVAGNVEVADGTVSLASSSVLVGTVDVVDGDVTVDSSSIEGDVTVGTGDVALSTAGGITGNVSVTDGDVSLTGASGILGNLGVAVGNVSLDGDSGIEGEVVILEGNLSLNADSNIVGDVQLDDGNLTLTNASGITGDVVVGQGRVSLSGASYITTPGGNLSVDDASDGTDSSNWVAVDINSSGVHGNVTVRIGHVQVTSGHIQGNVLISEFGNLSVTGVADGVEGNVDLADGSVTVTAGGNIDGNVNVNDHAVTLDEGGILGNVTARDGLVDLDNNSSVGGNVSVRDGAVLLDGISQIYGEVTLRNGLVALNDFSIIHGDVAITENGDVEAFGDSFIGGNISIDNEGSVTVDTSVVFGDVSLLSGDVNLNDGSVGGDVLIGTGNFTAVNDSLVGGDVIIGLGAGSASVTDSIILGHIAVTSGNVDLDHSEVGGDVGIAVGDFTAVNDSFVEGDVTIWVEGSALATDSTILGNVTLIDGDVNLDNSVVGGDVDIEIGNFTAVNDSLVGGNVALDNGTAFLDASTILGDLTTLGAENHVTLVNGSEVAGNVNVTSGNVTLDASLVGEEVHIGSGDLSLDNQSVISGVVTVDSGDVSLDHESIIGDYTAVYDGSLSLDNSSVLGNGAFVRAGDIVLANGSLIDRADVDGLAVFVGDGNVSVLSGSAIDNHVSVVRGNVSVDGDSAINGSVTIQEEGHLIVTNDSGVSGDVSVTGGAVNVLSGSSIVGDVSVTGGDFGFASLVVAGESGIVGDVTVGTGDIVVDDFGSIVGDVTTDLGDIDVLNDSYITGVVTIRDGYLTVDSSSSIYGVVDVEADGAANINGVIDGDVNLYGGAGLFNGGGVLYGNPVITGDLYNNGNLLPGYSDANAGTVYVGGDYIQGANGTYWAEVRADKTHDRVIVDGEAFLDGRLVVTVDGAYKPHRNDRFRLLYAEEGRTGEFDEVLHNFAKNTMLSLAIRYSDDSVWAAIEQQSFTRLHGLTHNQHQIASALDHAAARNQLGRVFEYLNYTDVSNVPALLQLLSPEQLSSIFTISTASAQLHNVNIERRLDAVRSGRAGTFNSEGFAMRDDRGTINLDGSMAAEGGSLTLAGWDGKSIVSREVVVPAARENRWSVFVSGHGEWSTIKNTAQAYGQDFRTAGVTLGADYRVSENFVIGLTGGYTNTEAELNHNGDVTVNSGRGSVYASAFGGGAYVNALLGGGYNSYSTRRATLGGYANGDSEGGEFNALLGLGYDFRAGGFTIGPVASLQYTYTGLSSFTETGSAAPQHFSSQHNDSLRTLVGLKASYAINTGSVVIRPEVRAQWKHEYLDTAPSVTARFAGADKFFTVNGPDIGRDSLVLDAGASVEFNDTWSLFAYYTGELGRKNYDAHGVNGGFRVSF